MCLRLNEKSEIRIAKRNIVVYKRLYRHHNQFFKKDFFNAVYQCLSYELEKLESVSSFGNENNYRFVKKLPKTTKFIAEGLHSFASLSASDNFFPGNCTVKCIIPKGTPYIRGTNNEVVSLKLIPKEIVKWT